MRLIDLEPLEEILRLRRMQCSGDYGSISGAISGCLKLVQAQPTITPPPNAPLTLEELREMDVEPVWITKNGQGVGYALVYSPCSIVYITCAAGSKWDVEDLLDEGCKIYYRKPEERTK